MADAPHVSFASNSAAYGWRWEPAQGLALSMVIDVFIAETQPHHPLLDQRLDRVFDVQILAAVDRDSYSLDGDSCVIGPSSRGSGPPPP